MATTKRWAVRFVGSGELWSVGGRVIVHDNPNEMDFLLQTPRTTPFHLEEVSHLRNVVGMDWLELRQHPDFAKYRFPLREEDFGAPTRDKQMEALENVNRLLRDGAPRRRLIIQ